MHEHNNHGPSVAEVKQEMARWTFTLTSGRTVLITAPDGISAEDIAELSRYLEPMIRSVVYSVLRGAQEQGGV